MCKQCNKSLILYKYYYPPGDKMHFQDEWPILNLQKFDLDNDDNIWRIQNFHHLATGKLIQIV